MNIRKADHIALLVANTEHSRNFYTQVLGMQEIPRPKHFNFPGAWLTKGNFQIHLIGEQIEGRAKQVYPGYHTDELQSGLVTHLAFEVDDLEAAINHLHAQGIAITGPRPRGDGVMHLYISDPDGYVIELFIWQP
jgi:catechol 2,3-dioxygenase-like lactoylglutathione lyase family enzyme